MALFVLVTLASLVSEWLQFDLLTRLLHDPDSVLPEEAATADVRQALLAVLQLGVYGATAIAFLVWFYRAYANLPALGMAPLEVGAGWAIGGWFVPLLNLVRPKEIMNDIWRGSDPTSRRGWTASGALARCRGSCTCGGRCSCCRGCWTVSCLRLCGSGQTRWSRRVP